MMQKPKKVFLIVTIPTHLRVLMEVANLLRDSGRFEPVMVYYPSAVFDQNHANCQHAPHEAFIWTGSRFFSKADYLTGAAPGAWLSVSPARWLPNKGYYRKLAIAFPFIPAPTGNVISTMVSITQFVAMTYGVVCSALFQSTLAFRSSTIKKESLRTHVNRSWLQRHLIHTFAKKWESSTRLELQSKRSFLQRIFRLSGGGLLSGLSDQKMFFEEISKLIQDEKPELIILAEANLFYNSQFVIRAAHLNKTRVAIVPFTIVNTLEWAEAFFDIPLYQVKSCRNRLVASAFPHWILEHKGRRLILPPVHILGCEYFDMVPPIPWLINSGDSDAIAAESHFMSAYYLRAGIQKEKIHFTGALSDDRLFVLLKERDFHLRALGERFCFQIREKIVLLGLPPDQFQGGKRQGWEFDSYEDLIRFMVGVVASLSGSQATVLINLHPRIKHADVVWLCSLGATIIDEPIERLVPLADIYVAVASATIRLGISCGVPVINYDAYQYDYDDYKGLAGVCGVKSKHDFKTMVDRLIHDQLFYSQIQAAQKATARNLCLVDGKAGERLLNLFDRLTFSGDVA